MSSSFGDFLKDKDFLGDLESVKPAGAVLMVDFSCGSQLSDLGLPDWRQRQFTGILCTLGLSVKLKVEIK